MNHPWHKLEMHSADIVRGNWKQMQGEFELIFATAGSPFQMGMYCDSELHENPIAFYFSPECMPLFATFFKKWGAVESDAPKNAKSPMVGHQQ